MKTIQTDELFQNLSEYLKTRGIELKEGSYARRIHRGCDVLTQLINKAQQTVEHTKSSVGRNLDRIRQRIHEQTAPRPAAPTPAGPDTAASAPEAPPPAAPSAAAKPARTSRRPRTAAQAVRKTKRARKA